MSEPYLGHLLVASFNYAPRMYALCTGETIPITQNAALYSLLGTNFGGDGRSTFMLPDLRSRLLVGAGTSSLTGTPYPLGGTGGLESVTLETDQAPPHVHAVAASSNPGTVVLPGNIYSSVGPVASKPTYPLYGAPGTMVDLANSVSEAGGDPHSNIQPYLALNYAIAIAGVFPMRT